MSPLNHVVSAQVMEGNYSFATTSDVGAWMKQAIFLCRLYKDGGKLL